MPLAQLRRVSKISCAFLGALIRHLIGLLELVEVLPHYVEDSDATINCATTLLGGVVNLNYGLIAWKDYAVGSHGSGKCLLLLRLS